MSDLIRECIKEIEVFGRPRHENMRRLIVEFEQLQQRNAELEQERDALAAHFNKLRKVTESWRGKTINDVTPLVFLIEKSPKASLAARDAEVAKRAFIAGYNQPYGYGYPPGIEYYAAQYANQLRNEAKDGE